MQRKTIAVAALLVTAGAVSALAAAGGSFHGWGMGEGRHGRGGASLKRLDDNRDQAVTADEYLAPRRAQFRDLDADKNGALDAAEAGRPAREAAEWRLRRLMKRLDQSKDGKISREEFSARAEERFAERDLDGDGRITDADRGPAGKERRGWFSWRGGKPAASKDELKARLEERFKPIDANADQVLDEAELKAAMGERTAFREKRAMHRLDKDRDGKISEPEFTREASRRFEGLDLDGDGRITTADLPPAKRWQLEQDKDGRKSEKAP